MDSPLKMMTKTKNMKTKMLKKEEIKTEYSSIDVTDLSNTSILKSDPDSILSFGELESYNKTNIKNEENFIDISSESNETYPLNLKEFHEEIDLNQEDSLQGASLIEPLVVKKSRKRQKRKTKLSVAEEKALKQQKLISAHPVLPPCENCRLKCTDRVSQQIREKENKNFWSLIGLVNRRYFILNHVKRSSVKRRTSDSMFRKRNNVFNYFLKDEKGKEIQVCKTFFLTSLGFKARNDTLLLNAFQSVNSETQEPKMDMRGKIKNQYKLESRKKAIHQHVESFHPCVSHFQKDLVSRRYLPNDLTIKDMHADFIKKHFSYRACSYEQYRYIFFEMNISFAKIGNEECDTCDTFTKHDSSHDRNNLSLNCEICYKLWIHTKRDSEAKEKYQSHIAEVSNNPETAYFTADLQKPLVLPRIDSVKETMFTRRLLVFNESFVPLGSVENNARPMVFLWHEAIAGRQEEEIISVFHQFFLECRDKKRVVLWLDDTFHQYKNWKFLSFLLYIVHSKDVEFDSVEIYYFEAGHNCLSTDSFYHQMESSIKRKGKIYDFKDFENAVRQTSLKNFVLKSMTPWDFRDFKDLSSPQKLKTLISKPLINDIRYLRAVRGSYTLQYRMNYDESVDLADLDFLQVKVMKFGFSKPEVIGSFRGIPENKKKEIIEKLVKEMPVSRRSFWYDLPEGDFLDLIDNNS